MSPPLEAKSLSLLLISFLMLVSACRPLQTARIKQDVTLDTHLRKNVDFNPHKTMIVLTLAREEKTLSKTTLSANEATADIFSLELLNRGCKIVDRANINDFMKENKIKLQPSDLTKILEMGRLLDADFLILTNLFENLQASHALTFLPGQVLTSIDTSANIGVSARMIDLKTGQVVWVGIATTQDQNFQMAIQRIVAKLIQSLETRENQ
jgi:curli biogenesis system outer membrane secretion channel CsgG